MVLDIDQFESLYSENGDKTRIYIYIENSITKLMIKFLNHVHHFLTSISSIYVMK